MRSTCSLSSCKCCSPCTPDRSSLCLHSQATRMMAYCNPGSYNHHQCYPCNHQARNLAFYLDRTCRAHNHCSQMYRCHNLDYTSWAGHNPVSVDHIGLSHISAAFRDPPVRVRYIPEHTDWAGYNRRLILENSRWGYGVCIRV